MKLIDRMSSIWAIQPDRLDQLAEVVRNHLSGPKVDIDKETFEKMSAVYYDASQGKLVSRDYEVKDGVGIIYIDGIILQRPTLFERYIFDAIGTEDIQNAMTAMLNDTSVKKIVMFINSPGGTVPGVEELSSFICNARGIKPIIAFTDYMMASAAYWIGSAADQIFISCETTNVGSIGVYCTHYDWSKYMEQIGVKATEIYAGKFKTAGSPNKPLDDDSKNYIQASVDHTYSVFVSAVARNRGTTPEAVLVNMADGRVFDGSNAIKAGLVDGVATFASILGGNTPDIPAENDTPGDGGSNPENNNDEEENAAMMTKDQLLKENPDLYKQIKAKGIDEGKKAAVSDEALAQAKEAGKTEELARVAGVKEALLPGYEKEIDAMVLDGKTTPAEAAQKIINMERGLRTDHINLENDPLPAGGESAGKSAPGAAGSTIEEKAKANWNKDEKIRSDFAEFEDYLAVFKREQDRG